MRAVIRNSGTEARGAVSRRQLIERFAGVDGEPLQVWQCVTAADESKVQRAGVILQSNVESLAVRHQETG